MKKIICTLVCIMTYFTSIQAQTAEKMSEEEAAIWHEYIESAGMGQQLEGMRDLFLQTFKAQKPDIDEKCAEELATAMQQEMQNFMTTVILPALKKFYTLDDIKQINAFYRTPVGKKMKALTPAMTAEIARKIGPWQKSMVETLQKITEKYEPKSKSN